MAGEISALPASVSHCDGLARQTQERSEEHTSFRFPPKKHQIVHSPREVGARREIMMNPKQVPRTVGRHFMPDQPLNLAHAFILLCSSAQSTLATLTRQVTGM